MLHLIITAVPPWSSSIRVLGIIYYIIWDADVTFWGEVGLRDQHNVYVSEGQVDFELFNISGETVGVPQHDV
jgi:hypothetical protein